MDLNERKKESKFRKRRCDGRTRGMEDELEFGGRGHGSRMQAVLAAGKTKESDFFRSFQKEYHSANTLILDFWVPEL